MTIDIQSIKPNQLQTTGKQSDSKLSTDNNKETTSSAQSTATQKDLSLQLTKEAKLLQEINNQLSSQPEVDQKRVAEIKQAIQEGTYKIDNQKLAENLLHLEKELLKPE